MMPFFRTGAGSGTTHLPPGWPWYKRQRRSGTKRARLKIPELGVALAVPTQGSVCAGLGALWVGREWAHGVAARGGQIITSGGDVRRATPTNVVLDDTPHGHKCHPKRLSCLSGPTHERCQSGGDPAAHGFVKKGASPNDQRVPRNRDRTGDDNQGARRHSGHICVCDLPSTAHRASSPSLSRGHRPK